MYTEKQRNISLKTAKNAQRNVLILFQEKKMTHVMFLSYSELEFHDDRRFLWNFFARSSGILHWDTSGGRAWIVLACLNCPSYYQQTTFFFLPSVSLTIKFFKCISVNCKSLDFVWTIDNNSLITNEISTVINYFEVNTVTIKRV